MTATMPDATDARPRQVVDWSEMRALHVKGLSLADLSRRFSIPYSTVKNRAMREKWSVTVANATQMVVRDATAHLAASASAWIGKVDTFVHRSLDSFMKRNPDELTVKDLASLMSAASQCATIARQNYGLDADNAANPRVTLNVQVIEQVAARQAQDAITWDVDAIVLPEQPNPSADASGATLTASPS